jgi:hypothetical protein
VEGPSDVQYLRWFLTLGHREVSEAEVRWPALLSAEIVAFGGVSVLGGFVKANYGFIREEVAFVPIFDGDEAGRRETRNLRGYLNGHNVPFQANSEYILLPNGLPIEGLFPNKYLTEMIWDHPSWFKDKEIDSEGQVVSFSIFDDKKESFAKTAMFRAERDDFSIWAAKWLNLCDTLERCLQKQGTKIRVPKSQSRSEEAKLGTANVSG